MKKNILIVDNDARFVDSISEFLKSKGYSIISASDSKDGLKKLQNEKFDLILVEVMLKHKTEGIDMVKKLKSNSATRNLPVIIVTGIRKEFNLPFGLEVDEERLPANVVLEKPVKAEMLLQTIEKLLNNN